MSQSWGYEPMTQAEWEAEREADRHAEACFDYMADMAGEAEAMIQAELEAKDQRIAELEAENERLRQRDRLPPPVRHLVVRRSPYKPLTEEPPLVADPASACEEWHEKPCASEQPVAGERQEAEGASIMLDRKALRAKHKMEREVALSLLLERTRLNSINPSMLCRIAHGVTSAQNRGLRDACGTLLKDVKEGKRTAPATAHQEAADDARFQEVFERFKNF